MELSQVHNPYDFANPVSDANLFVGRTEELAEIRYYIEHAKTSPRPINIALLGPRASGKTSLLNMCELEARNKGFCTVRIDLDEGDVKSELAFFFKIFDGLLSSACELGTYGGKSAKTYDTYLDIANSYKVPDDKTFCPFLFPLQYAKAMASGNLTAQLSDHAFRTDLAKIRSEVGHPTLLLFDEGNVLATSRVHLEKLRNTFMNTPGFMLVMTGTPDLFPMMDEVFSPIIRQFKKIPVEGFKNREETRECIKRPLESIGVNPDDLFDFDNENEIKEIHDLAAGRPYEIQLICHTLFRSVQEKRSRRMKLNLAVLEAVRRELETSQDLTSRPVLARIKSLNKDQMSALGLLCICDGQATFEQIWAVYYTFKGSKSWTKAALQRKLDHLANEKIVEIREGIIKFAGDEFDKIYTKYLTHEQAVELVFPLMFPDFPLVVLLSFELYSYLASLNLHQFAITVNRNLNIEEAAVELGKPRATKDVFSENGNLIAELYPLMTRFRHEKSLQCIAVEISFPWATVRTWTYYTNATPSARERVQKKMNLLRNRAERVGGTVSAMSHSLRTVPMKILTRKVERTENTPVKARLAAYHVREVYDSYPKNPSEALFHARLACRYTSDFDPISLNNLGYVFMSAGELRKAKELLTKSVQTHRENRPRALPNYNLGVLEAMRGKTGSAIRLIDLSIKQLAETKESDRQCACLLAPRLVRGKLRFKEVSNPDLLDTALNARAILLSLSNNAKSKQPDAQGVEPRTNSV